MGLLDKLLGREDINTLVAKYRETDGAYLIDVRTSVEYEAGHIPGSINIPLSDIHYIVEKLPYISAPLFVYCQAGTRSAQACSMIREMGYKSVTNIGGMNGYKGELER